MASETLITQGGFSTLLRGLRYKILKPTRSFFSPIKGIPPETVITLTGDIRIEVSLIVRYGRFVPAVTAYIGVQWGKNLKGTDWIKAARFQRNAELFTESFAWSSPTKKRVDAAKELKRLSYSTRRR